jgi:hypothetical protein
MKVIQSFPHFRNFETPTWESRDKKPFRCGPLERHKVHYKGEGGGFPQVRAVVSLMCPSCSCLVLAPKVLQQCSNHLVLVLCRSVWVSKTCHFFLIPSRSSSTPPLPLYSVANQGACPDSSSFRYFQFGIPIWIPQGVGSASMKNSI